MIFPRCFTITAEYRHNLINGNFRTRCTVPARNCVYRCNKSTFYGYFFKFCQMLGVVDKFIFNLYRNYVSAILIEQSFHFVIYALIPLLNNRKIFFVVVTKFIILFQKPIGETAVSALAVCPWAYTNYNVQTDIFTFFDKRSDVIVTAKIHFTLNFFVVYPKQIR